MTFTHWLHFIAAFLIVIGVLSVGVGIAEWWRWRREGKLLLAFLKRCRITIEKD